MPSYDAVVYVPNDCSLTVEAIEVALTQRSFGYRQPQITKLNDVKLSLLFGSWELAVYIDMEPDTEGFCDLESPEAQLAVQCTRHIQVISSNSDPDVEHLNHFLLVIETIQNSLPGSRVFDNLSGEEI